VKGQCLPFTQIPHSTRLFLDYLSYSPPIRAFYPRSPLFPEWVKDEAPKVRYDGSRRRSVSDILERQNRGWGSGAKTLTNIDRLRRGALAVVTGQQVVLFGGPLFSIFKALTAVKLAERATAEGVETVPIFWLATEDHDLAEVNHVSLLSEAGMPEMVATDSHSVTDAPVGEVQLGPEIVPVLDRVASLLGESEVTNSLRESYTPGQTLGTGFARLFARLFQDWGVILLDPSDPELHQVAAPIFKSAIERSSEIDEALLVRNKELEAAGYHQQVKVTPATTLLFGVREGARTAIRRKNGSFMVGTEPIAPDELARAVAAHPENFNPNVLLRPVIQDYLLPTLTYTGGSAEVAYFAQVGVVYERLLGRVTPVLPRFSATLVEPKPQRILERYRLTLSDLFHGPEKVRERIAAQSMPADLKQTFEDAKTSLDKSMNAIRESLTRLDPTLTDAAVNASAKMHYQLTQLEARAARAESLRNDVISRHADALSSALFPNKVLQEREIAGVSFLARYGTGLLNDLYQMIHADCNDHQIVEMQ